MVSFSRSQNMFLKITEKHTGLTVGTMTAYVSPHHSTVDLGILIGRKEKWGQGLAQDAWNTLMRWLLEEVKARKITGGAMRANTPMIRIMEKSGMVLEAVRYAQELLENKPQDLLYYAKFNNIQN